MAGHSPLQQKFLALLQGTINFFSTPQPQYAQDRKIVDQLRADALKLAEEATQPGFDAFLAYLLAGTSIEAHYPLQTIRLLCVVARAAHFIKLPRAQFDEIVTAAYFCDVGFRAAWLGQKGSHAELAAYRIKEMQFAWFAPGIEKIILSHHTMPEASLAQKIVPMAAAYLALVYGLGVDVPPSTLYSPVKAFEALVEQYPGEADSLHELMRILSAYPLGSWVETNTGQVALVIGANLIDPLRPRIGYAVRKKSQWHWEEHALQQEPQTTISRELVPSPSQAAFVNAAHLWINGWEGQGALTHEQYETAFGSVVSIDGSAAASASVRTFLGQPAPAVSPATRQTHHGPAAALPGATTGKPFEGSDSELQHLRADWEKHVHLIEESANQLRHGLIESYRRENSKFKEALNELRARVPTGDSAASRDALLQAMEAILAPLEQSIRADEQQWTDQNGIVEELCSRVRKVLEATPVHAGNKWQELSVRWQSEWDRATTKLLDPLHAHPAEFAALKAACAAARAFAQRVRQSAGNSTARQQSIWEGRHRPALEHQQALAAEARHAQVRRLDRVQRMAERYLELAEKVAASLPKN